MDRETARQEIRNEWRRIIPTITTEARQKVNGETSYICPFCGHGTHGDGMTFNPRSVDRNGLKCMGCGWSGDIIDLYQQTANADFNTALNNLADLIGISIDRYEPQRLPINPAPAAAKRKAIADELHAENGQNSAANKDNGNAQETPAETPTADYMVYYMECMGRVRDPAAVSYLKARGISMATADAYMIGFDPAADPASAPGAMTDENKLHPVPRIIIPVTHSHYVGRSIVDDETVKGERINADGKRTKYDYRKLNSKGEIGIFNAEALQDQSIHEIFVTEGAFDALSIIECGATAIALNSTSNAEKLLKQLEQDPTRATLILCSDNDNAGKTATERLKAGLLRLNIPFITADICGSCKDPNEALTTDRKAFTEAIEQAQRQTAARPDNISFYIDNLMSGDIERFKSEIKTGFSDLDKKTGGIYSGLYVIAAISSLGKTTFAAQLADNIAASGQEVLFFSMEQSRLEMVTKSIARKCFQNNRRTTITSLSIRKGYLPQEVRTAAAQYKQEVQERISVIEGNFKCDISFIGDYIREYIRKNGTRPVIMIDYLQVLQPEQQNGRQQTTKETIDISVTELKRISRELELPIFVISSVNRANYLTPIDFESLKESGSIEYTCDCLWGLQFQCLNDPAFDKQNNIKERREIVKKAKAATPRKIELVCLKNRYGIANFSCYFDFYPANDYFEENSADLDFIPETTSKKPTVRI